MLKFKKKNTIRETTILFVRVMFVVKYFIVISNKYIHTYMYIVLHYIILPISNIEMFVLFFLKLFNSRFT